MKPKSNTQKYNHIVIRTIPSRIEKNKKWGKGDFRGLNWNPVKRTNT